MQRLMTREMKETSLQLFFVASLNSPTEKNKSPGGDYDDDDDK